MNSSSDRGRLAREIEHHRQIAAHAEAVWNWDSPSGRRRAARRVELFVTHGQLAPGKQALELGCGTGLFLEQAARSGAQIRGLDLSTDLLKRAAARVGALSNVSLHCGNAEQMPYPDDCFDTVYGSSVLHHLRLEPAIREIFRVLRPGGRIVFAEPNMINPQIAFMYHVPWTKEYFAVSPDEMAFSRFHARGVLRRMGYQQISVVPFDFLHPAVPERLVSTVERFGRALEKLPLLREIAGSLVITARKG